MRNFSSTHALPIPLQILNYVIVQPRSVVTLDLFEAEKYEPAIIVQSLIGNLVYYSNCGQYEPRLAKKWQRLDAQTWSFELHQDLVCEDGEPITPSNFQLSLERIILYLSKSDEVPVLNQLVGYKDFVRGKTNHIEGISTNAANIFFKFNQPTRSGVVEILSFAPFGYISAKNLNSDGSWKNQEQFLSSGPYRCIKVKKGSRYQLKRRTNWALEFAKNAPDLINFTHIVPEKISPGEHWIIDSFTSAIEAPDGFELFQLAPRYLHPIIFGNLETGFFSKQKNREHLKSLIEKHRESQVATSASSSQLRATAFYPGMPPGPKAIPVNQKNPSTEVVLSIEGSEPIDESPRGQSWAVLKAALNEAQIAHKFENNEPTMEFVSSPSFDIRMRGSSIGTRIEVWGIRIIFCSDLGLRLPDPSGRIHKAANDYDAEKINDLDFSKIFLEAIDSDSAIVPVLHSGIQLYFSPGIVRKTLSPNFEVIRFDQIELGGG